MDNANEIPTKGSLVEIIIATRYGKHQIKEGDLGVFIEFVKTDLDDKEYGGIILEWFFIYMQRIGQKIAIPRSEFEIVKKT